MVGVFEISSWIGCTKKTGLYMRISDETFKWIGNQFPNNNWNNWELTSVDENQHSITYVLDYNCGLEKGAAFGQPAKSDGRRILTLKEPMDITSKYYFRAMPIVATVHLVSNRLRITVPFVKMKPVKTRNPRQQKSREQQEQIELPLEQEPSLVKKIEQIIHPLRDAVATINAALYADPSLDLTYDKETRVLKLKVTCEI